jgi:hypothetical protein
MWKTFLQKNLKKLLKQQTLICYFCWFLYFRNQLLLSVVKIVDYVIRSRSESFCAAPRDWRPRQSRGRQLGEAQEDLLLWTIYEYTILSSSGSSKLIFWDRVIWSRRWSVEHRVLFNKKYERSKFRQAHYVHWAKWKDWSIILSMTLLKTCVQQTNLINEQYHAISFCWN